MDGVHLPARLGGAVDRPAGTGKRGLLDDYDSVGGGSYCTSWTRAGRLIRLDCIVSANMVRVPIAEVALAS